MMRLVIDILKRLFPSTSNNASLFDVDDTNIVNAIKKDDLIVCYVDVNNKY
jgi:hypothetical protein